MGFRISSIHDYDRFLTVDLGSYRVRAGLYAIEDGEVILEGYGSVRQNRRNIENGVIRDMPGFANIIEKTIYEACRECVNIPDDMIIAFTPNISLGEITTSQYIRKDSQSPLLMEELDIMIEKIEKISLSKAKEKAKSEYAIIHDDIRLVSSTLTSISIDGKNVDDPIGTTGEHIRITVLNIYALASEYNVLRSVVSSLHKNIISLVPTALIFPKLVERSDYAKDSSIIIDIGYTHVTIVSIDRGEIQYFETFSIGVQMLIDMIADEMPKLSFTEIESLLMRDQAGEQSGVREQILREYFSYLLDALSSVFVRHNDSPRQKHVIISGGIFGSKWIEREYCEIFTENICAPVSFVRLDAIVHDAPVPSECFIAEGLSSLGYELLHTKKDPIIRLLRYTLYHYE